MEIQNFSMLGISHEDLNLEQREIFHKEKPQQVIEKLHREGKIRGFVELATCLRLEFYIHWKDRKYEEEAKELLPFKNCLQAKNGEEALKYLAHVICGFESIIKGEDQILAQVRKAYQTALEDKKSSKLCNIIFQKMIELGKDFRSTSKIAENALSLEAITVQCIRKEFPNWEDKKIFILGAGDMSQTVLKLLVKGNPKNIYICNRTHHRAEEVRETYGVNVVEYEEKYKWMGKADIIISATSAPHLVIKEEKFRMEQEDKNYCFLDLAVPRDIDSRLSEDEKIKIFNLDDLFNISRKHGEHREQLLEEYHYLLDDQIATIKKSLAYYQKGE